MKKRINRTKWGTLFAGIGIFISIIGLFVFPSKGASIIQTNASNSPIITSSSGVSINYSNTKDPNYLNSRTYEDMNLGTKVIVERYFSYLQENKFQRACSLIKEEKCDASDGEVIKDFSRERQKLINGYEDLKIIDPNITTPGNTVVICARYAYQYKTDLNPGKVWEILAFYIDKREDGNYEITSRVCEKKYVDGIGERRCPYVTSTKFCKDRF